MNNIKSLLCRSCGECCKSLVLPVKKPESFQMRKSMTDWLDIRGTEIISENTGDYFIKINQPCPHLIKGDNGMFDCDIYEDRPDGCKEFDGSKYDFLNCAWRNSNNFVILEKSKKIWVPPSGRKRGYWREDPREKHDNLLDILKNILNKIRGLKKQGKFTDEQRKYVHRKLKEIEPRLKHFKTQGQHIAVAKMIKEIRAELTEKTTPRILSKDRKGITDELRIGLKRLGYTVGDLKRKSLHEIKTIYYNDISKE